MADLHNVFISHYSGDVERMRVLQQRLAEAGCSVRNSSAEEDRDDGLVSNGRQVRDETIAEHLRAGIRWAGTVIVVIGEHTHERPWVNYEIQNAHNQGKQIIGIYDYGCRDNVELPEAFKRYGNCLIGWNSLDRLAGMLKGDVPVPEAPDGTPATPIRNIIHIECR